MKLINGFLLVVVFSVLIAGCKKEEEVDEDQLSQPAIVSLTADKMQIEFGGADKTTITAQATGGDLTYTWSVDFGDIIPQNEEASIVKFSGSACCIGNKEITCSVSNAKGEDSEIITILINEP